MPTLAEVPTSKLQALGRLIGNTPLITIHFRYEGKHRVLYAKSEYLNLTGSIRTAWPSAFSRRLTPATKLLPATPLPKPPVATPASPSLPSAACSGIPSKSSCPIG